MLLFGVLCIPLERGKNGFKGNPVDNESRKTNRHRQESEDKVAETTGDLPRITG